MKGQYLALIMSIVLISVLFLSISGSIINNKITRIGRADRAIRTIQEQLNSARLLQGDLREVSIVIENSLTEARELSISEANEFTRQLAELADEYKLSIFALFPRVALSQNRIIEQQFAIELECTYVQLGQFLASIERYDYIIRVNTLEVKPQTDKFLEVGGSLHTLYRVTIDLTIFKIVREA